MPRLRAVLPSDLITLADEYDIDIAGRRYLVGPCKRDRSGVRIVDAESGQVLWADELRLADVLRYLRELERVPTGAVRRG